MNILKEYLALYNSRPDIRYRFSLLKTIHTYFKHGVTIIGEKPINHEY